MDLLRCFPFGFLVEIRALRTPTTHRVDNEPSSEWDGKGFK